MTAVSIISWCLMRQVSTVGLTPGSVTPQSYTQPMAQCTAPYQGHRTNSGRANCPACGGGYGGYTSGYSSPRAYYSPPPPPTRHPSFASRSSGGNGGTSTSSRARRSAITYTTSEYQTLNPVRQEVVRLAQTSTDRRDLFLCHAWADREGDALELYNLLTGLDVSVWFSEKDVPLGTPMMRQIDKGLKNSRAGVVLVTPAMLESLDAEGIADKELSVLLGSGRVIPIAHNTTFDRMRDVSPMLASHAGLTTSDYGSLEAVALRIADMAIID